MDPRLIRCSLFALGLAAASCKGSAGDGAPSGSAKGEGSILDALVEEPAMNTFCKGADGTLQDCKIACDTTKAKDVCDLVGPKTVALCKQMGKDDCQKKLCEEGKYEHACEAVRTWVSATCEQAGPIYGKLFAKSFNEKGSIKPEKHAAIEKAFIEASTTSCTTDGWKPKTIDCVAASTDAGTADRCVQADYAASSKLTKALQRAVRSISTK